MSIDARSTATQQPLRRDTLAKRVDAGLRPFYFSAIFWGAVYRGYFTDLLLASLLSPNNIPALDRRRGSKFLIAAPAADWEAVQDHPMLRRLRAYAEPEWLNLEVSPDDHRMDRKMLAMSRGHRLIASRAFDDRAYGVFVTPDLILSDGSVAAMERFAEAGKKVVLAVAIRYQHEPVLAELEQGGYLKPGQPLAIGPRDLMHVALRHLHSETLRYEYEAPWFGASPVSVYWQVPDGGGIIIHSFSWAPLLVDYGALSRHDTQTFDHWTLDGDYIYRNFPEPADVHVITDSDEIALVSFTKESDLHFELTPYLAYRPRWITDWYKVRSIRVLKDSGVMDPLKRRIFPIPVYLHAGELSPVWSRTRVKAEGIIARAFAPGGRRERLAALGAGVFAPDLLLAPDPAAARGIGMIRWLWHYRRFAWQRMKEKLGLTPGRSRLDDGRDWVTPALGPMHPIWSLRVVLWWSWRYRRFLWQRIKEKTGLAAGRSRVDDGRDWLSRSARQHSTGPMCVSRGNASSDAYRSGQGVPRPLNTDPNTDAENGHPR